MKELNMVWMKMDTKDVIAPDRYECKARDLKNIPIRDTIADRKEHRMQRQERSILDYVHLPRKTPAQTRKMVVFKVQFYC